MDIRQAQELLQRVEARVRKVGLKMTGKTKYMSATTMKVSQSRQMVHGSILEEANKPM